MANPERKVAGSMWGDDFYPRKL